MPGLTGKRAAIRSLSGRTLLAGLVAFAASPSIARGDPLAKVAVQVGAVKEDDSSMSERLGAAYVDRTLTLNALEGGEDLRGALTRLNDTLHVQRDTAKLVKGVTQARADVEMADAMKLEGRLHMYVVQVIARLDEVELHGHWTIANATKVLHDAGVKLDALKALEVEVAEKLAQAEENEKKAAEDLASAEATERRTTVEEKNAVALAARAAADKEIAAELKVEADKELVRAHEMRAAAQKKIDEGTYLKTVGHQEMVDANVAAEGLLTDEKSRKIITRDERLVGEAVKDKEKAETTIEHARVDGVLSQTALRDVAAETGELKLQLEAAQAAKASAENRTYWCLVICLILFIISNCLWTELKKSEKRASAREPMLG